MNSDIDRREQGTTRIPFDALVEVGGMLGPPFEAQAVDLSPEGMHLRTAYLPEVGQALSCRFDAGHCTVSTSAEVVWRREEGRGGEFGIRFTNLDPLGAEALRRVMGVAFAPCAPEAMPDRQAPAQDARVRLHIDGLGSPMRARVRDARGAELTVGSELGFLQVGKQLELEDASTGDKRPAHVDRVEVEIDPESNVPQLVVTLRYDDLPATDGDVTPTGQVKENTPEPSVLDGGAPEEASAATAGDSTEDLDAIRRASDRMKGALARGAAKLGPAMVRLARRAKTTAVLLASRRGGDDDGSAIPLRRTTAPAPAGALRASGKRVVRESAMDMVNPPDRPGGRKRKMVLAGAAVLAAGVIGFGMVRSSVVPAAQPAASLPASGAQGSETIAGGAATTAAAPETSAVPTGPSIPPLPPPTAQNEALRIPGAPPLPAPPAADVEFADRSATDTTERRHAAPVTPFGSGPVGHGVIMRLHMDGTIDKIEGAPTPTGFSVRIPGRRSLEPAAPLAQRDGRIASVHVANEANGAELTMAFRDGVPNYLVRARGDALEIVLAAEGAAHTAPPPAHPSPALGGAGRRALQRTIQRR